MAAVGESRLIGIQLRMHPRAALDFPPEAASTTTAISAPRVIAATPAKIRLPRKAEASL